MWKLRSWGAVDGAMELRHGTKTSYLILKGPTGGNSSFHHWCCPSFSFQITVIIIIVSPLGKKDQKNKESSCREGKLLFITFIVPLLASASYLHLIPLCVPLVMRQSCGSLWNLIWICKTQAQCTLLVSCSPSPTVPSSSFTSVLYLHFSHHSLWLSLSVFICISFVHFYL